MTDNPNVPPNPPTPPRAGDGGSRALYFIVGGLVVLAAVFVFVYLNNDLGGDAQDAGMNAPAPAATEPATPAPAPAPAPEGDIGGTTTNQ